MTHIHNERRANARRHGTSRRVRPQVRIRPGHSATLLDISAGGALIETTGRLLPNTFAEVCMEIDSRRASLRCRVLRCAVALVTPAAVRYRAAIQFDSYLPWFVDDDEPLMTSEMAGHTTGAQLTSEVG